MQRFRDDYAQLKISWGGYAGYDSWVARANNASLGAQAAYDDLVPGFENLFEQTGSDWPRFYDAVRQLARQPQETRRKALATDHAAQNIPVPVPVPVPATAPQGQIHG